MSVQPVLPIAVLLLILSALATVTIYATGKSRIATKEKIFTVIRLSLIYVLAFIVGLRPVLKDDKYEFSTKNLDVLFVIDTTISMWAQDYDGSDPRIDGAIKDAKYIADELIGSNFALVTFDDQAHVISPYTQDITYVESLIDTLAPPDSSYAMGSDMSLPYKDMESLLVSSSKKENRKAIVVFISDGEITNGNELTSYEPLKQYVDAGVVLGYGTRDGGQMRASGYGWIIDESTGEKALSMIDEDNLKGIADDLGLIYNNMNNGRAQLESTVQYIKDSSKTVEDQVNGVEKYKDIYYIFAAMLAVLLLAEACIIVRRGRL
ncbi:VWA domain-containing protein [Butyrivibrio sp. X503]|uniref:vWA domain-containing protein n=1 Tax=Butyrivibrio sp. X503 TaxID=2364878 RepID=UPI000EA8C7E4|nr:vWA domain-containing protein [Butyrivibrio sp. X503]RKM58118.1 VWA domain-containing protein [Butyrivibrio sp. X503]